MEKVKIIYSKICTVLSLKKITWITILGFILSILPICYLSFVNRATGDDYGYGIFTRAAWVETHSLIEVLKASWMTIKQYYVGWQGTWFDIFLFSLQPEVFSDKAYVIVAYLMLFLWCGSTIILFKELFIRKLKNDKLCFVLITILFLMINIHYIPSTKSAIFWFNGCAHYMVPFVMCQIIAVLLLNYCEKYKGKYLIAICAIMTLLGGANYQAALFALIVAFYGIMIGYTLNKNKKIFLLLIPIICESIGLIISIKAPGNKVRGGEEFGFSVNLILNTIWKSFVYGIKDIGNYLQNKPIVFIIFLAVFFILLENAKRKEGGVEVKHPFLIIMAAFCLYSAMQAPAIYANVNVSGGVYNTNYQCFLLLTLGIIYILSEVVGRSVKGMSEKRIYKMIVLPGFLLCGILILMFKGNIKDSTGWICMDYIISGQASDYREQMKIQTELMLDETVTDVIVPGINDIQGPLMHMPVTPNKNAWSNSVTSQFYGKRSVIAIDRSIWESMYLEKKDNY